MELAIRVLPRRKSNHLEPSVFISPESPWHCLNPSRPPCPITSPCSLRIHRCAETSSLKPSSDPRNEKGFQSSSIYSQRPTMPLFEITRSSITKFERIALSTGLQNLSQALGWHINSVHVHFIELHFDFDMTCTTFM